MISCYYIGGIFIFRVRHKNPIYLKSLHIYRCSITCLCHVLNVCPLAETVFVVYSGMLYITMGETFKAHLHRWRLSNRFSHYEVMYLPDYGSVSVVHHRIPVTFPCPPCYFHHMNSYDIQILMKSISPPKMLCISKKLIFTIWCSCCNYAFILMSPKYFSAHKEELNLERHLAANEKLWYTYSKSQRVCVKPFLHSFCAWFQQLFTTDKPFRLLSDVHFILLWVFVLKVITFF